MLNLSGLSIGDAGIVSLLGAELGRSGIDPGRIVVEVTEPAATVDIDLTRDFLRAVGDLGVRSALDDFGSGLSSFGCLRELPVDLVKIDGALIRPLPGGLHDLALVRAIVDVAHAFGMLTVAEHVGSEGALAALRDAGVDFGQGYHLGRPRPAASSRAGHVAAAHAGARSSAPTADR